MDLDAVPVNEALKLMVVFVGVGSAAGVGQPKNTKCYVPFIFCLCTACRCVSILSVMEECISIISMKEVKKNYPLGQTTVEAVKGVSFEIQKGDFISIAGPSGSGKSTILNMIGYIDTPTAGSVSINGVETSSLNDTEITKLRHRTLGYIFQSFNLIPVLNVFENIEFPLLIGDAQIKAKERKEWVDFLIEEVGLSQWSKHRSNELSGG